MRKRGHFNDLSEEFLASLELQDIKKDEKKTFRLLNGRKDPTDPTRTKMIWQRNYKLPITDKIWDTVKKEYVDIGTVLDVDKETGLIKTRISRFVEPNQVNGEFVLYGHVEEDRYIYWFLQMCSKNKSSKNRSSKENEWEFEEVDVTSEAKARINLRSKRLEVETYLLAVSYQDLKSIAAAFGMNQDQPEEVLRDELIQFGTLNPDTFLGVMANPKQIEGKALVKKAFDAGVLEWHEVERKVVFGGATIATLPRIEGRKHHEQLEEYLNTTKNGEQTLAAIKKVLAQKGK